MNHTGSAVPKRQLGVALRKLREGLGLDRDVPAATLECSPSKIGRIETGDVGVKASELRDLLDLYQVAGPQRADLLHLGTRSRLRHKRTSYGTAIPDWFRKYVSLEEEAIEKKTYDTELVTGLFQIEEYARAVIFASPLPPRDDVERLVQARMARQELISGPDPMRVWAVLNEGVLHRAIGGAAVLRRQLQRLRELADRPNITIQVIPFDRGAHAATGFTFTLLRLSTTETLDVVYLEDLTSARYVDNDVHEQQRYAIVWNQLTRAALTPVESANLLDTLGHKP